MFLLYIYIMILKHAAIPEGDTFPNGTFFFKRRVFGFLCPQSTAFRIHQALGFGHWYNSNCWNFEDLEE